MLGSLPLRQSLFFAPYSHPWASAAPDCQIRSASPKTHTQRALPPSSDIHPALPCLALPKQHRLDREATVDHSGRILILSTKEHPQFLSRSQPDFCRHSSSKRAYLFVAPYLQISLPERQAKHGSFQGRLAGIPCPNQRLCSILGCGPDRLKTGQHFEDIFHRSTQMQP